MNHESNKDIAAPDLASFVPVQSVTVDPMQESFTEIGSLSGASQAPMDTFLNDPPLSTSPPKPLDSSTDLDDDLIEIRTHMTSPSFVSVHSLNHGPNGGGAGDDVTPEDSADEGGPFDPPGALADSPGYVIIYPHGGYEDTRRPPASTLPTGGRTLKNFPPEFGLEKALEARVPTILIYAEPLGEHTSRWIRLGNFLHKAAVLTSFTSVISAGLALKKIAKVPVIATSGSRNFTGRHSDSFWPSLTLKPVGPGLDPGSAYKLGPHLGPARMAVYVAGLLVGTGALCTLIYTASWQSDPCCKYQVLTDSALGTGLDRGKYPASHPIRRLLSSAQQLPTTPVPPVVLIYRDDRKRKILHCGITALAAGLTIMAYHRLSRLSC